MSNFDDTTHWSARILVGCWYVFPSYFCLNLSEFLKTNRQEYTQAYTQKNYTNDIIKTKDNNKRKRRDM